MFNPEVQNQMASAFEARAGGQTIMKVEMLSKIKEEGFVRSFLLLLLCCIS